MRKEPDIQPPPSLQPQASTAIVQKREYRLITPLYGGGVTPAQADPVTVIRAPEIRGQLRFWWRACRGGQFDGDPARMKREEDAIWGKAWKKGEQGLSPAQTIQVLVEVDPARSGQPFPFQREKNILLYAAFPLESEPGATVRKDVYFTLTIVYPLARSEDVEAALWAWETFGGVGARTRRGFGALHLLKVNNIATPRIPASQAQVEQWLAQELRKRVLPGNFPPGVPHLGAGVRFVVSQAKGNAGQAWNWQIEKLRRFRQARDQNQRGQWPEARAIRAIRQSPPDQKPVTGAKFPRAALGLPIIFHFKDASDPPDSTLNEAETQEKARERFASPLILRPLLCAGDRAVALALVLAGSRVDLQHLLLLENRQVLREVQGTLTKNEANQIPILGGEKDVLQAFLSFFKE